MESSQSKNARVLAICTVGGSPDAIVKSLTHWKPLRVFFVHTPQTRALIEDEIVPRLRTAGVDLDPGRYDCFLLTDEQNLEQCAAELRRLTPKAKEWAERGGDYEVVVDFTGGTKCMSAAFAMEASRWPCTFSYVGGTERTKDGVGVVVAGAERVVHQSNPWDALGHHAVEDFIVLFDQHAYRAACDLAGKTKKRVSRPSRKREFAALETLASALDAWDRFDHDASRRALDGLEKSSNDLDAILGPATAKRVSEGVSNLVEHLDEVIRSGRPSIFLVRDLLANAKRRGDEGRFDDGVARLYRAIEATAQLALKERHRFESTEKIAVEDLPEKLRDRWRSRARRGSVSLGLQDAYLLLNELGDPVARDFQQRGWDVGWNHDSAEEKSGSPLVSRNKSILAHGFDRVSEQTFDSLWKGALSLLGATEQQLPSFPVLGVWRQS